MSTVESIFNTFPVLETERLRLRQIRPSDAQALYHVFNDPEVTRFYDQPTFTELSQADTLISRMRQRFAERRTIRWAVTWRDEDALLGTCGFADWKRHFHCAAVGYELGQPYWRQGIMREGLTAVLHFGFKQMQLNRIEAYVMSGNEASLGLLYNLGFQKEGLLRDAGYWQQAHHDLYLFALLKRDFLQ